MQGDIALAGFMLTKAEWNALDAPSRALLIELASGAPVLDETAVAPVLAVGSAPISEEPRQS